MTDSISTEKKGATQDAVGFSGWLSPETAPKPLSEAKQI